MNEPASLIPSRHPLLDNPSIEQMDRPVRKLGVSRIVRHHADRRARPVQLPQQRDHRFPVLRIQVPCRLVGQQDQRISAQGSRYGHALLLSSGELRRIMLHPVRQRFVHPLLAVRPRHVAVGERKLHILVNRQVPDQG